RAGAASALLFGLALDVLLEGSVLCFLIGEDRLGAGAAGDGVVAEDERDAQQTGLTLRDDEAQAHSAAAGGDEAGRAGVDEIGRASWRDGEESAECASGAA